MNKLTREGSEITGKGLKNFLRKVKKVLTNRKECDIMKKPSTKGDGHTEKAVEKLFSKKLKKGVDKSLKV